MTVPANTTDKTRKFKVGGIIAAPIAGAMVVGALLGPGGSALAQDEEAAAGSEAAVYAIDPVHSSVIFRIMHLNTAPVYGRFNEISGTIAFDEENPENSRFQIKVPATSVDTNNERRDAHLRSADFFTVEEFTTISFESTSVSHLAGNTYQLEGEMSLLGTTEAITIRFEKTGEGENQRGQQLIGGEAVFTINRSDYGMTYMLPDGLGDEVTLMIGIEAIRQ